MAGIIERAKSIEARLDIGPAPHGGTCVRVHWEARA
jgi:signal transduction histidine kinase